MAGDIIGVRKYNANDRVRSGMRSSAASSEGIAAPFAPLFSKIDDETTDIDFNIETAISATSIGVFASGKTEMSLLTPRKGF